MPDFIIPADAEGIIFCVSTSHMDWDWIASFEQYYSGTGSGQAAVHDILESALSLINSNIGYQYNLAEIAWLRRYMEGKPAVPPTADMIGSLHFLGGGITSPDNIVCNGEAFIRNYLIGQQYVKSIGLGKLISNVCWIPDDFGHDPQLPVVLNAMGMRATSFWRVPGLEPAAPYAPAGNSTTYNPTDTTLQPLSTQLAQNGVTFNWQAADGSTILAQQMADGYGVIWNQSSAGATDLVDFVNLQAKFDKNEINVKYPGNLYMAPCGGDFSQPSEKLLTAISDYNSANYPTTKKYAVLATFQEYLDALKAWEKNNPLNTIQNFNAGNFWTGHFASRVQLKINQQRTVNMLMAGETLSTLLHLNAACTGPALQQLNASIAGAWNNVVPSTHHDYVNGTSSDNVYLAEQLPLGNRALGQAEIVLREAMALLGGAINAGGDFYGAPFVVFNPSGFERGGAGCPVGALVEIPKNFLKGNYNAFSTSINLTNKQHLQVLQNGNLVLPAGTFGSTAYSCVYLVSGTTTNRPVQKADAYTFSNGTIEITVTKVSAWAITGIVDVATGNQIQPAGAIMNQLSVYYECQAGSKFASGNLYQMGNELYPTSTNGDGFYTDASGVFEGYNGEVIENGPYRWHFKGYVYNTANELHATVEYILDYNEPLVRMKVTGNAANNPGSANTIVTSWGLRDTAGNSPAGMQYGTPNHWTTFDTTPYWYGPTFSSTHDFITLSSFVANEPPIGAIYHEGMRAWALESGQLMGILFRNAPATGRGAHGTDTAVHTQHYAFRVSGVGDAASCQPLMESLAFQQPLLAAPVESLLIPMNPIPASGYLAALTSTNALIRLARTQPGSGSDSTAPFSFVMRMYQPSNDTTASYEVMVPLLSAGAEVSLVTALEENIDTNNGPTITADTITIPGMATLATVRVETAGQAVE